MIISVSAIIATSDRSRMLERTLISLTKQSCLPIEIIIVDASADNETKSMDNIALIERGVNVIYLTASKKGATFQRMQGIEVSSQPFIWFLDDDILMEQDCVRKLWEGMSITDRVGAVSSMITNQRYSKPGRITNFMYRLMHGSSLTTYAGKIIGPAWNLLPEDEPGLPEYTRCEWVNTTCTFYRRDAMPIPVFPDFFYGYSMFEDVTLSVLIGRKYDLLNARTARIFHDSQPGLHKNDLIQLSQMSLVNRYYVMTRVLKRTGPIYHMKLALLELFGFLSNLTKVSGLLSSIKILWGKVLGVIQILKMNGQKNHI